MRALKEADDLAVQGIRGHPVPGFWREDWCAGRDDRVEPLGQDAIRLRHLSNGCEYGAFPFRPVLIRARFRLQLFGALLHRGSFLVCESGRALLFGLAHRNRPFIDRSFFLCFWWLRYQKHKKKRRYFRGSSAPEPPALRINSPAALARQFPAASSCC